MDKIEELEIGSNGLTVEISDARAAVQPLRIRAPSTSGLTTTASVNGVLREGNETKSISSQAAKKN